MKRYRKRRITRRPKRYPVRRSKRFGRRRAVVGVSPYRFAKLYYCDVLSTGVAASSYATYTYQSSGFDPYVAVGGHQPMYYDQYAAMYQRYTVMGVAYYIECATDQATNGPLFITCTMNSDAATPTTLSTARERTGTKETCVSHGYKGILKGYASVKKIFGASGRTIMTDDQYSALVTANPLRVAYLIFQIWNVSGTASVSIHLSVRLKYYVRFFDPTDPSPS